MMIKWTNQSTNSRLLTVIYISYCCMRILDMTIYWNITTEINNDGETTGNICSWSVVMIIHVRYLTPSLWRHLTEITHNSLQTSFHTNVHVFNSHCTHCGFHGNHRYSVFMIFFRNVNFRCFCKCNVIF